MDKRSCSISRSIFNLRAVASFAVFKLAVISLIFSFAPETNVFNSLDFGLLMLEVSLEAAWPNFRTSWDGMRWKAWCSDFHHHFYLLGNSRRWRMWKQWKQWKKWKQCHRMRISWSRWWPPLSRECRLAICRLRWVVSSCPRLRGCWKIWRLSSLWR